MRDQLSHSINYFLFTLFGFFFLNSTALSQQNSPFSIQYKARTEGNAPFVEFTILPVKPSTTFTLKYGFADTEGSTIARDSVVLSEQNSLIVNSTLVHRIASPDITQALAFTFILSHRDEVIIQQGISIPAADAAFGFSIENISNPSHLNYVVAGEQLKAVNTSSQTLYIYKLNQDFQASPPPMYNATYANAPSLTIDTLLQVDTQEPFMLTEPALYYAQTDTTKKLGIGIKVVPEDFPKFRKVKRVIEPMLYISTQAETKTLRGVSEPKNELDAFWLNLGGSPENAKRIIKNYFQRVTYANHVFTNYKLGWKTDRGIVHIIFGTPDRQVVNTNKITWIYQSLRGGEGMLDFEFEKRPNQFTGHHYELVRDVTYKSPWNNVIKLWRNGLIR